MRGHIINLFENYDHKAVVEKLVEGLGNGSIDPVDVSLRELWEATVGPVSRSLSMTGADEAEIQEALTTSVFPKASSALIQQAILAGYDEIPTIGDNLVTRIPSRMKNETFLGFNDSDRIEEVGEGEEYPRRGITERYYTGHNRKFGGMVEITEETILFDQTGQILGRATDLGRNAAEHRERMIIQKVTDQNPTTDPVYRPSGTAEALYSTGNSSLEASNSFGEAGLSTVKNNFDNKTAPSTGKPIGVVPKHLLIPSELEIQAWKLLNSLQESETANNALNFFRGRYQILSSPYMPDTTSWFLGDFPRQFRYTDVIPMQVTRAPLSQEDMFERDIRAKVKVRYMGDVVAIDERFVVKSTA